MLHAFIIPDAGSGGPSVSVALTSLAILKVNFDRKGKDTLDNFLPFIADRIYELDHEVVALPELQEAVRREYGLLIPANVIKTLTKRCIKMGLLERHAGVVRPIREKLAGYDLGAIRADVRRNHNTLVEKGCAYARTIFDAEISHEDFDAALQQFIRDNAAPLLNTIVEGHPLLEPGKSTPDQLRYIVAPFLASLTTGGLEGYGYLAAVVKGSLLASALYFPDIASLDRKFDRMSVYLDTTLLLRAVGACGPEQEALAGEVIKLALAQGAHINYFEHTLQEVVGVLSACKTIVKRGGGPYVGEAAEYMMAQGWEVSDVVGLIDAVEERLASLGVTLRESPSHSKNLTLDEIKMEEVLQAEVRYRNRSALLKDLDSLTAIYRLRSGKELRQLERTRAIFITHNSALVRAARKYGKIEDFDRETIPLCLLDYVFASLLWVKSPLAAPDLPERAIIADCYAAMRADDRTWQEYVEKIEKLEKGGVVSSDEYVLLRQSLQVRSLIMFETSENPEEFTEGTVRRVLLKAQENIAAGKLAELEAERQARNSVAAERDHLIQEVDKLESVRLRTIAMQNERLEMMSRRFARRLTRWISLIVGALSATGLVLTLPVPGIGDLGTGSLAVIFYTGVLGLSVLNLYGMFTGGSLATFSEMVEHRIARAVRRWLDRLSPIQSNDDEARVD